MRANYNQLQKFQKLQEKKEKSSFYPEMYYSQAQMEYAR